MDLNRYKKLSENAQRLLCYHAHIGIGTNKRMSEHLYVLSRYCFASFDGETALTELVNSNFFIASEKDWYTNSISYGIRGLDLIPILIYLYTQRKDLLLAFEKSHQQAGELYKSIRASVQQLVESNYTQCDYAAYIQPELSQTLIPVIDDPQFKVLISNLSPDTFADLYSDLVPTLIEHDKVCDCKILTNYVKEYSALPDTTKYKFIAQIELYDYIATGNIPEGGLFANIWGGAALGALRCMGNGNYDQATTWFSKAKLLLSKEKSANDANPFSNMILNMFYVSALMHVNTGESKNQIQQMLWSCRMDKSYDLLAARILAESHVHANTRLHRSALDELYTQSIQGNAPAIYSKVAFFIARYMGFPTEDMLSRANIPNIAILRHEMAEYIALPDDEVKRLEKCFGTHKAISTIYHKSAWETVLEDLTANGGAPQKSAATQESRIMYIRPSMDSDEIVVREQTRLKNGSWGSGKNMSDAKFRTGMSPSMNDADRRILARLNHSPHWELRLSDVIEEMDGDDRLYYGKTAPFENIKVEEDTPYLIVEKEDDRFIVKSNVPVSKVNDYPIIIEDTPTHYLLIHLPQDTRNYYTQLLQLGAFPLEAEDSLREFLPKIGGKVEIHSSLIEGGSTLPITDGNPKAGFKFTPKQSGNYNVEVFVRPLTDGRRTYPLCAGDDVIIDEANGKRTRVMRNMTEERENLIVIRNFFEEHGTEFQYRETYTAEFLLELITFIQSHPDICYAEWPEGHSMRIRSLTRGSSTWNGVVKSRGAWFEVEGDIQIDADTVMSINQLLDLVNSSQSHYIQLGNGEFLALSEKLQRQLKSLNALANRDRGNIKISPFSAALMSDDLLFGEITLSLDRQILAIREKIINSSEYKPEVPSTLNATLRPYQIDGYQWIARLNSWGAGALLADDMGLGKTIQTIAFLLLKADKGPSLVVAPASVAPNWQTELERFAPSLNSQILNFAANRKAVIDDAKAGDVIITTYGILLSIQEYITNKHWNVACLDEAHIIKNRGAKTSAAAMKIKADNRVMLTGTPVQNHLGELWSLFQFVNPGMLGGYENFSHKFIIPIEGYQDEERRKQLENIVHPFMLRRTKQAVLKELPDKIEIYQPVELSTDELAIYESIRRRAEELLKESGEDIDMNVLAEITRLRQAACSSNLIEPKWKGECSKINTLSELLQGVIEGGNRALVFSQFVSFFDLVRKELEKRNMPYFYIDGSTPVKKRTELVEQFQNGEGNIFLISLKAGGLGLNLTGANYVVHLDPWWNPAIEQQATDRAYRIGQNQAVTVYHLVSKGTIEEKIIRLHQTKRDLADNILAGTDSSHKLTGKDLLEMVSR